MAIRVEPVVEHVPQTGGRRRYFEYRPERSEAAQLAAKLRVRLREWERVMTQPWRYSW
jgi:glucans biosynthesis protein